MWNEDVIRYRVFIEKRQVARDKRVALSFIWIILTLFPVCHFLLKKCSTRKLKTRLVFINEHNEPTGDYLINRIASFRFCLAQSMFVQWVVKSVLKKNFNKNNFKGKQKSSWLRQRTINWISATCQFRSESNALLKIINHTLAA